MPNSVLDPDLRNRELDGDDASPLLDIPEQRAAGDNQGGGSRAREFVEDARKAADDIKDLSKKAKSGAPAPTGGAGAGAGAGEAGAAAGSGAASTGAATAGTGAAATGGAGTAGAGAATAAGGGAVTGAGVVATGAAEAGAAAAGAGAAATTGAATGAAGGVAAASAAAGTATAETGVGAVIGYGIAIGAVAAGFIAKYRKEFFALGSVIFVGVILLIVALLNALKPIAATQQTSENYLGPVQQIVDNRTVDVLGRYITGGSGAAVSMAAQQEKVAANGGHVLAVTSDGVVNDGKLKVLYDAMKTSGFEARLKEKYELEFKPGSGAVDIVHKGKTLGSAHNALEATAIMRQQFPEMQALLSEDINGWSWAQHTKVARGVMRGGMIPTLAIPNAESARGDEALTGVVKYQYSTILKPGLDNMNQGIACYTQGTGCNAANTPVTSEAEAGFQTDERSSMTAITQKTYQENLDSIKGENDYNMYRLDTTTGQKVSASLTDSSVGILGWLDIAATTKAMSEKQGAQELPATLRTKQSGALWSWNLSAVNQMLGKDVSSPASSLIARNYANIEDSQAYNYVAYNDAGRGQGFKESEKVNSKMNNAFSYVYQSLLVENPIIQTSMSIAFDAWLIIQNTPVGAVIALAAQTPIGSLVNRLLAFALEKVGVLQFVEQTLGISTKLLLPICDPADKTYNFFNCMATGAHAVANTACEKFFGCGKISLAQENALKIASREDMQARLAALPLERRLFDQAIPGSFINVAAMNSPLPIKSTNDVASLFQGVFSAVWSAPGRVASLAAAPAKAANADSSAIDGIDYVGIPLNTIRDTPLANEASQANGTCPTKPAGEINMCLADMSTIDALTARFTLNPALGG